MNSSANTPEPGSPSIHVDNQEVHHLYVNAASVAPSIDECILDLGISSVTVPPTAAGQSITPEMAANMQVVFRHQGRVYLNWAAAKRLARTMTASVQAHEQAFGEIMLLEEREDLAQKAAGAMSGQPSGA